MSYYKLVLLLFLTRCFAASGFLFSFDIINTTNTGLSSNMSSKKGKILDKTTLILAHIAGNVRV